MVGPTIVIRTHGFLLPLLLLHYSTSSDRRSVSIISIGGVFTSPYIPDRPRSVNYWDTQVRFRLAYARYFGMVGVRHRVGSLWFGDDADSGCREAGKAFTVTIV